MNRRLFIILTIVVFAAAAALGLAWRSGVFTAEEPALVGGPFQLVDQNGRPVDEGVLKGKWSAVFFGFTACPDVCPTTMFSLGQATDLLGPRGQELQTVFISVDPGRDTPAQMRNYLSNDAFPKGTIGLTGSPAQVDRAAKAYRVYHQKSGEGSDYLVDHSTVTYLMNPDGRFVCVLPAGLTPEQTAERIGKAMREGRRARSC